MSTNIFYTYTLMYILSLPHTHTNAYFSRTHVMRDRQTRHTKILESTPPLSKAAESAPNKQGKKGVPSSVISHAKACRSEIKTLVISNKYWQSSRSNKMATFLSFFKERSLTSTVELPDKEIISMTSAQNSRETNGFVA